MRLFNDPNLKGYWPLDGNSLDYKGTNNGTVIKAIPVSSGNQYIPASLAYKFNGTSDYIIIPDISSIKTIMFLVNPVAVSSSYFQVSSTVYISDTSGTLSATGFTSPNIYVNGKKTTTIKTGRPQVVCVTTDTAVNGSTMYIGRQNSGYLNGKLQEAIIFSRALSAKEISDYYTWITGAKRPWIYTILSTAYELIMEAGSFTLSGQAVGLQRALQLIMSAGAYTLVGMSASFWIALNLIMSSWSYVLTGFTASIFKWYEMILSVWSYVLSWNNTAIWRLYSIILSTGSYILTWFNLDVWFFKSFRQSIPKIFWFNKTKPTITSTNWNNKPKII